MQVKAVIEQGSKRQFTANLRQAIPALTISVVYKFTSDPPACSRTTLALNEAVLILDSNFLTLPPLPTPAQLHKLFFYPGVPLARL
jgi:hypothetical protein